MLAGLLLVALAIANRLGFVGLLLLGALTWFVCTMADLDNAAPTWGADVFRASMSRALSPEHRAAAEAEHQAFVSPLRFYGRCGMALAALGAAGIAWEVWRT